jgi:subtilase family serine protease
MGQSIRSIDANDPRKRYAGSSKSFTGQGISVDLFGVLDNTAATALDLPAVQPFRPRGEVVINQTKEVSPQLASLCGLRPQCFWFALFILIAALVSTGRVARAANGQYVAQNTPAYVSSATNLGPEDASKTISVSIWLQPHNRSGLDALAQDLYNRDSANYRHWLKSSEISSQFAPTAAEANTVRDFFESNNLKVTAVGPNNFYVRAQGTVGDIESAFHVQINEYQVGNQTFRANASDPYIDGPASALVQAVSGLDSGQFVHTLKLQPSSPETAAKPASISNRVNFSRAVHANDSSLFETVCFPGTETKNYTNLGSYPKGTYTGNEYNAGANGCGYSPSNIYTAYNLNGLYAEGYNGTGQTVVIIDWCGSPTIRQDAKAFSQEFGLPALTTSNFSIINYPGPSACAGVDPEINLDVEWTHAIAPGANIDLVVPPTADFEDVDEAVYYAANSGLGNVISGSYASPEFFVATSELTKENLISEMAAIAGVATNFASGDYSNYATLHIPSTVSVPADLPYATGVGGVSLALNSDNSVAFQTGWETHDSILVDAGVIYDPPHPPPFTYGFDGGSGGGPSGYFKKPSFQSSLPGGHRRVPDVSWLADPFTGAAVLISEPGQLPPQVWSVIGGTSLSTPMFSALWAIANEEAGEPLGQAAPYLYSMPSTTITDVLPGSPVNDITAVIQESSKVTHKYNPAQTLDVVPRRFGPFYSAMWVNANGAQNTTLVVSFGEDYFLKTEVGWDDVTGLGTPNGQAFADWFAPPVPNK